VWPDKALGERIAKDFIAILVDVDQEPETAKQYGVKAMPTLVIADSTEKVLVTQVGAPFSTPAKAREWFDGVTSAISKIDGLEKTYADKPDDADNALKLVEAYQRLGKNDQVVEVCEKFIGKLAKSDKKHLEFKLTLGKHRLDNAQSVEDLKKADELLSDVLPALLAAKDRRAIETTLGCVRCNGYLEQESKTPVQLCKAIGVFPDDADTAKLCTALSGCLEDPTAMKDEDRLAAQKELEAIVKSAPKDSEGALYAKAFLKTLARAAKKGESTKSGK
jgi:tetratricopeptide (TPR) repeat protein